MTPTDPPQWHLDESRNAWYYYSPAESCLIYQDGLRLRVAGFTAPTSPPPNQPSQVDSLSRDFARTHVTEPVTPPQASNPHLYYQQQQSAYQTPLSPPYTNYQGSPPTGQYGQGQYAQSNPYQPQPLQQGARRLPTNTNRMPRGEGPPLQDPRHRFIRGTRGDKEKLDSRYQVRKPGKKYFKTGVVFKILWPEPANALAENRTVATEIAGYTTDRTFGERINVKIRWFVVVREGQNCSSCLPLQTYGSRGAGKPGLIKSEHAIVYTGDSPPPADSSETDNGQDVLLRPIRVIPRLPNKDKIDPWCRINFGKIYTVEHNVKVYDWGVVDPRWRDLMKTQFQTVFLDVDPEESDEDSDDEDEDGNEETPSDKGKGKRTQ